MTRACASRCCPSRPPVRACLGALTGLRTFLGFGQCTLTVRVAAVRHGRRCGPGQAISIKDIQPPNILFELRAALLLAQARASTSARRARWCLRSCRLRWRPCARLRTAHTDMGSGTLSMFTSCWHEGRWTSAGEGLALAAGSSIVWLKCAQREWPRAPHECMFPARLRGTLDEHLVGPCFP